MIIAADKWTDYELIDTSDGRRLERWGDTVLIRPDPQIVWNGVGRSEYWDKADALYVRSDKGGGRWKYFTELPEEWTVEYEPLDLKFKVKPTGFKHTGLFPEQAVNWDYISEKIKNADREVSVLNLFAYTGGASVAAAAAGAKVCHVDAAKGMVNWARDNAQLSGIPADRIRYIVDDCVKFAKREIRRGNKYDGIIMDPPSYGRGPGGEMWRLSDNISELLNIAVELLSDNPLFFILNSYTAGISSGSAEYLCNVIIKHRLGGEIKTREIGLPVTQTGLVLPCGTATVWHG